jgi:hypothetical protein
MEGYLRDGYCRQWSIHYNEVDRKVVFARSNSTSGSLHPSLAAHISVRNNLWPSHGYGGGPPYRQIALAQLVRGPRRTNVIPSLVVSSLGVSTPRKITRVRSFLLLGNVMARKVGCGRRVSTSAILNSSLSARIGLQPIDIAQFDL